MASEFEVTRVFELAGTVAFPPTFPELGEISLAELEGERALRVAQCTPPKVIFVRTVLLRDVRAVFLPKDPKHPDLSKREGWHFGYKDSEQAIRHALDLLKRESVPGLIYVPEPAQVLTVVLAGMTAAESAEYYPPIVPEYCRVAWCKADE